MGSIPTAERVQFRVLKKSGLTTNRLQFHPPEAQNHHLELQGGTQEATGAPREAQRALQKPFFTIFEFFSKTSNSSIFLISLNPGSLFHFGLLWETWKIEF